MASAFEIERLERTLYDQMERTRVGHLIGVLISQGMRPTAQHSFNVARIGLRTAVELGGTEEDCIATGLAGAAHDIGKIFVKADTDSPRRFSPPERKEFARIHTLKGALVVDAVCVESSEYPTARRTAHYGAAHHHGEFPDEGDSSRPGLHPAFQDRIRLLTATDMAESMLSDYRSYRPQPLTEPFVARTIAATLGPQTEVFAAPVDEVVGHAIENTHYILGQNMKILHNEAA